MRQRSLSSPARSPSSGGMHVLQDPAVVSSAVATGLWPVVLVHLVGMALCCVASIISFIVGVRVAGGDCYLAAATCCGSFALLGNTPPGYDRTLRMDCACGTDEEMWNIHGGCGRW